MDFSSIGRADLRRAMSSPLPAQSEDTPVNKKSSNLVPTNGPADFVAPASASGHSPVTQATSVVTSLDVKTYSIAFELSLPTWRSVKYSINGPESIHYRAEARFRSLKSRTTLRLYEVNVEEETRAPRKIRHTDRNSHNGIDSGTAVIKDASNSKEAATSQRDPNIKPARSENQASNNMSHTTDQTSKDTSKQPVIREARTMRGKSYIGFIRGSPYKLIIESDSDPNYAVEAQMQRQNKMTRKPSYKLHLPESFGKRENNGFDQRRHLYWKTVGKAVFKAGHRHSSYELRSNVRHLTRKRVEDDPIASFEYDASESWLKVRSLEIPRPISPELELWTILSCMTLIEKRRLHHTRWDQGVRALWDRHIGRLEGYVAGYRNKLEGIEKQEDHPHETMESRRSSKFLQEPMSGASSFTAPQAIAT